uniref:Lymphocyte antigen 75 n=1 Tax=Scleropages formosus TaxID=113540 RepID=A0A8C9U264_SCLFO
MVRRSPLEPPRIPSWQIKHKQHNNQSERNTGLCRGIDTNTISLHQSTSAPLSVVTLLFHLYWGERCLSVARCDDAFSIHHVGSGRCLESSGLNLGMGDCSGSLEQQWKWGFGHRLFHVATAQCLGLQVPSKTLALLDCDSTRDVLWWRCAHGIIRTAYQLSLSAGNGTVSAWLNSQDSWTRHNSSDNICRQPYRVIHTTMGNSFGAPCQFPFRHNGSWHHGCVSGGQEKEFSWCATTHDYDGDRKWGYCLKPGELSFCLARLLRNPGWGSCYQYNLQSALPWREARASCLSQGGDLLSFSSLNESAFIAAQTGLPNQMWIGLNQLDTAQGWQWSDGSPLSFVKWNEGMPFTSVLQEADCAAMNSQGLWESEACGLRLPYICKKYLNQTEQQSADIWLDGSTSCESGWKPWNGFCYQLVKDPCRPMLEAQQYCEASGGALISMHSLVDVEAINMGFHDKLEVWTGLRSKEKQALFYWTDNSSVSFTYWARDEPQIPSESKPNCVSYFGQYHLWRVSPCEKELPFVCKKKGNVKEIIKKAGCPEDGDWKRHGNACYKVDTEEVLFQDRCDLTIMNRFEQLFINSLIKDHITTKTLYFWMGLQDINGTGEFHWITRNGQSKGVPYTNWNRFEPELAGGCVVMSTAQPLGKWEVKDCELFKAGSICKTSIGPQVEPDAEPDLSLPCPPGWVTHPDVHYCYKVFHEERLSRKRTWGEAERFCEALGAHLVSLSHKNEMQALQSVISETRYFWVGLNRRGTESGDAWEWSDGRAVSADIFSSEFHEDDEYSRDCAAFKVEVRPHRRRYFLHAVHDVIKKPFYAIRFRCDAQLEWVCQIPRGKKETVPDWYNPNTHHESSIFVDGSEFWFVTNPKLTYDEAREFCWSKGSKLATPMTYDAAKQIREKLSEGSLWWVDVLIETGTWPFSLVEVDWALLNTFFTVHTYTCKGRFPFVCERLKTTSLEKHPLPAIPIGLPCDNGFLTFGNKCYMVIKPLYVSFAKASEHCHTLGGTLLTIANQVEQDFVTSLLSELSRKFWIGLEIKETGMEWVDNSTFTFHNFNPLVHGQYRPIYYPKALEQCAYMINDPHPAMTGTWDYTSCMDYQYISICQHYADKPESPHIPASNFTVGSHTYRIIQKNVTWFEALQLCKEAGMDLVSVTDTYQQAALTVAASRASHSVWIGLFSEDDGFHYRWTDHSHVMFSRWSPKPTVGQCVYQDTDGFWKATECEEVLKGAICQIPQSETTLKPEKNLVKCPHKINGLNWIPFRNNCYAFQLDSSRWESFTNVRDICKKFDSDSDILTIRDEMENEFVKEQLLPFKDLAHFVWLGIFRDENVNRMKWYDGTNVQYSNWRDGRPSVTKSFMAGLGLDGVWEIFADENFFSPFQQRSIVACKIDNDPKEEFQKSPNDVGVYGNSSYYIIERQLAWFDAVRACRSAGGHLASAHDFAHDAHLELMSKKDGFPLWIGLSTQDMGSSYEWSDGTSYDYTPGSFVSSDSKGDCVFVNTKGLWQRANCSSKQEGAICYNSTVQSNVCPQASVLPVSRNCPQGGTSKWIEYNGHCYTVDMPSFVYTMKEAKSICRTLDDSSQLLTIKSKEENNFVSGCLSENPLITDRIWLGIDLDHQGQPMAWVDGTSVALSFWETQTEPSNQAALRCVVMQAGKGGVWSYVSCEDTRSRVVCKGPSREYNTRHSHSLVPPTDWLALGKGLFTHFSKAMYNSE